ncbi:hypothetical protein FrCorBMG51_22645 [Protofrankia coriariae]|uniref:Uncharacterized protein n=1 Tax=Protofrankia coriariae TaxID=1562887 RepID=A0ABR5EZ58_9ACTN|nr:hypothetical protein FrCorBMG51_22645 [Protofrankia coriariae]
MASFVDSGGNSTEFEIVDGAFDDPAVLRRAFEGVEAAFLALGTSQWQAAGAAHREAAAADR